MVVGEVRTEVDVAVIGGGPGGYAAAIRLGQLGKSVVLIEKENVGGVCLNKGCIPSKALIHTASKFEELSRVEDMGIQLQEKATMDLGKWQERKKRIISQLTSGIQHLCNKNGVTIVEGKAYFLSDDRIGVETSGDFEVYQFENAIIATGSEPAPVPFATIDHEYILNSTSALELTEVPDSLLIVGGGYIGMELGMALAKLGSDVTVVEVAERILPATSKHLTKEVVKKAKRLGMTIQTSTYVDSMEVENEQVVVTLREGDTTKKQTFAKAIVTIGRTPRTKELGLEQIGVTMDERGLIPIDETCRTNIPHLFAIGDITAGPALAHKATKQGIVAAEVIGGLPSAVDSPFIPYAIFTDPEIAGVGMTVEEAKEEGYEVKTAHFPFQANGMALATDAQDGFVEVIVDKETHLLLGCHIVGKNASQLIGEGVLGLELGVRAEDIALTVHPHPTLTEGWTEVTQAVLGKAIHILN